MKYFSFILCALLFVACENDIDNPDWPDHDPKFVITASVSFTTDSVFVFCRVSRTMGLGENFQSNNAMVNDAEVYILNDGKARSIPFRRNYDPFTSDANYSAVFPRGTFTQYVLTVRKGDLNARSELQIPDMPLRFDSLVVNRVQDWWEYEREGHFVLSTPINRIRYDLLIEEELPGGAWTSVMWKPWTLIEGNYAATTSGSFRYAGAENARKGRYTLIARSPEYGMYEDSRYSGYYSGSPFEPDEKNPPFNITGDGIGFFWYELFGDAVEFSY